MQRMLPTASIRIKSCNCATTQPPLCSSSAASSQRRKDIARARGQWEAFLAAAPKHAADMFSGRGIVILAGRLPYMAPAWINVHMLRRTGGRFCHDYGERRMLPVMLGDSAGCGRNVLSRLHLVVLLPR